MTEEQASKITREQLYNEIWEISVAGVAKKYNANYRVIFITPYLKNNAPHIVCAKCARYYIYGF